MCQNSFIIVVCCISYPGTTRAIAVAQVHQAPAQVAQQPALQYVQEVARQAQPGLSPAEQYALPALLQKGVMQINIARGLSVDGQNRIITIEKNKLCFCDLQGEAEVISCLKYFEIKTYCLAGENHLFIACIDGSVWVANLQKNEVKNVFFAGNSRQVALCAIDPQTYAYAFDSKNEVGAQFPQAPAVKLKADYAHNIIVTDGQQTFAFGNRNNAGVVLIRRNSQEILKIKLPVLPTTLALGYSGELYMGGRDGRVHIANAQQQWSSFDTGICQPISFIAVLSDILMVAYENNSILKAFSLSDRNLLYTLKLSNVPVTQLAVNHQGIIVCIDEAKKLKIWSIKREIKQVFSALAQNQRGMLQGLIAFSQQYELSPEMLEQQRAQLALLPEALVANVQKMSPMRVPRPPRLEQERVVQQGMAEVGRGVPQEETLFAALHRRGGSYWGTLKHFVQGHSQFTLATAMAIFYVVFRKAASRKPNLWLSRFSIKNAKKPNFLWF